MKGKVNCTCGWSWNKSDSSVKDMYICHQCGRDNSNNMKNGGGIPKAQGGENVIKDERSLASKTSDETKVKMPNASKINKDIKNTKEEKERERKDYEEWLSTGFIKHPRSIIYKKAKEEGEKKQTYLTQAKYNPFEKYDQEKAQAKEAKKQFKKNILAPLDVATDIMQLGNFVPHPYGQAIGEIGNFTGAALDAYQAIDDFSEGDYVSGGINTASVFLPMALGSQTFRRNSKYLQPGQPLYPLSPQANLPFGTMNIPRVSYIEPFTKVKGMTDTSLLANRALLGTLGAETIYDASSMFSEPEVTPTFQYQNTDPKKREEEPVSNPEQLKKLKKQKSKFLPKSIEIPEGEDIYAFEGKKGVLAKNGGWLDQYADGGTMQEHQENYNDSQASAPQGMIGDGFSNVGRNYSPAWGGQFQMGGNIYPVNYVPQAQEGKTMFKKPSILQQEYIDPIYSYSERTKLYPGEEKVFKERPGVAGMATEDNRVIINPYSPISKEMKDLVRTNETARLAMRNGYPRPDFELTPKQQEFFNTVQNGNPYSEDLQDIKETIAARVMTGDDSAQDYTKEQEMYADKLFDVLKKSKEYATGMTGMMKSKIGMGNAFGHPAIKRMSQAMPKTGMTPEGIGTHYMNSVDNYAVPELQDLGEEELTLVDPDSRSREAIRFNSPEEANYFAEHYKDVAPMTNIFGDLNSFKAGGSIPGSVGFTYARTKGIPSNGPYAKKTMASAQNGKEMQYYQNGLDFQPKTISKNGGWLDGYEKAQEGIQTTTSGGKDIKVKQPDGTIKIVNTGSPEYEEMYKAGNIQSPGAGEGDNPLFGGELPEVVVQQEMTPLLKAEKDYGYMFNKEAFINRKKDEYLKSLGRQNWFGASRSHFPKKVLSRILREYDYKQNTRALEDVAKVKGFDLNTRGEWIYDLTPAERKALINSKYSAQLNPNEFAEMASGVQQLLNTVVPGQPWNIDIPGLTQRELKEDRESWLSPLKTFAPLNMPGNLVANFFRNIPGSDVVETPRFGMQRMGDVSELEAMALNPLNITMIEGAANLLTKLPSAARAIGTGFKNLRNVRNVNAEGKIFSGMNNELNNMAINDVSPTKFNFIKQDLSEGNNIKYIFTNEQGNNIATFSGRKSPEGIYVNSIEVNPEFRRQGVASDIYKNIAKELQSKNEGTLFSRSGQHQFTDKDELGRSIAPANKLWENLVNKGEAEKFVEGMFHSYRMKPLKQELRTAGPSLESSVDNVTPTFKSEIDWGKEYFEKIQNKEKELQDLFFSKKITEKEYLEGVPLYEKELAKELGLENKLGSGNYGKVFELPNDPSKVIKLGNPMSGGGTGATNWTPELIEKLKSIKQNANIAIPEQVEYFEIPSLYQGYGPKTKEVMTMPNLNQVAAENLNLNKRDRYALFLKQARQLRDQGIQLDVKNIENFKFNKDKGVFDIYDINPGYISNPGYYMQDVVNKTRGPLFEHMQFKQGGIIKDDRGQGNKITEFPIAQYGIQTFPARKIGDEKGEAVKKIDKTFTVKPGKLKKVSPFTTQVSKEVEFMKNWTNSPMYNQMLNNSTRGVEDEQDIKNIRKERLNDISIEFSDTPSFFNKNARASSKVATGNITFYPSSYSSGLYSFQGTPAHEISHTQDSKRNPFANFSNNWFRTNFNTSYIPQSDINMMNKYSKSGRVYDLLFNKGKDNDGYDESRKYFKYVAIPTETRARLNSLRYLGKEHKIYDPYTQKINMDQLEKLIQRSGKLREKEGSNPYTQLRSAGYNDEEILNMLNTISQNKDRNQNPNIATAKDGRVIKDDRGQWAYPGEITEIGSNQITMQGVPYPVLGISDTGDVQMMYPEEEYEFDGEKVTEIPMAQDGIKQELNTRVKDNTSVYNKKPKKNILKEKMITSGTPVVPINKGNWLNRLIAENITPYGYFMSSTPTMAPNKELDDVYWESSNKMKQLNNKYGYKRKVNESTGTYSEVKVDDMYTKINNPDLHKKERKKIIDARNKKLLAITKNTSDNKLSGKLKGTPRPQRLNASQDALNLHQGIPQKYNSFVYSNYRPSNSKDDSQYYSLAPQYEDEIRQDLFERRNADFIKSKDKFRQVKGSHIADASLKDYQYSKGEDEKGAYIAYYDVNDYGNILDILPNANPFEIYGRIYYDKKTGKPIAKHKNGGEYPMAKNGLRQEQKGLVNLDNLLNFTNYNKPQPGGWLSKYE